ncbi:hypothetical protein EDB92DRAFT_1956777 [Lactarius akahatsu]|uniref:Uncharacterized protein n=1 Tax=Lactarius akahatsu TaxID=416441 RepID=A0AAD4Q7G4_9AGAM|nr:hypothetical protein EDB92DRAFT_1956777 [Lactarius akahatsu]
MRRLKLSQNLDIKDMPSLVHSPSMILSTILDLGLRMPSSKAISHISRVPWPRSPSRSPLPLSPDTRPPSGLGRRASIDPPVSPSFLRMSEMFPSVPKYIVPLSARSSFQMHPTRACSLSSPAFLHSPTKSVHAPPAPPPPQCIIATTTQTTLTLRIYRPAHSPSFVLVSALALRSMRSWRLMLPAFDAELLSVVPGTLPHLTLLANTLPYAFFNNFLAAPAHMCLTHLALLHFNHVPPAAHNVPPTATPHLAMLNSSPSLTVALAPSCLLQHVTIWMASTLYDSLRPAALFGVLSGSLKELVLVPTPDVDVCTHRRLLGVLGNTGAGLKALKLSLDGTSDEYYVSLQALYKQTSLLTKAKAGEVEYPADITAYQVFLYRNDRVASPYHNFYILDSASWPNAKYIDRIPVGVPQLEDLHAYFGHDESLQPHPTFYASTFANRNYRLLRIATRQEA